MRKIILALSIIGIAASSALAQTSFEIIDVDQSGGITLAEATAAGLPWTQEQFNSADTDSDGTLNVDEFAAATQ